MAVTSRKILFVISLTRAGLEERETGEEGKGEKEQTTRERKNQVRRNSPWKEYKEEEKKKSCVNPYDSFASNAAEENVAITNSNAILLHTSTSSRAWCCH